MMTGCARVQVCSKCFTNSQSLLRHSMCHTGNKPYICDECGKKFSQVCTLKRHQATHSSNQPRRKRGRKPVRCRNRPHECGSDCLSVPTNSKMLLCFYYCPTIKVICVTGSRKTFID